MSRHMAHLLEKLERHRESSLGELASKAFHYANESTRARVALRSCDAVGFGARVSGRPIVRNLGEIRVGKDLSLICWWCPVELSAGPGATLTLGDSVIVNYGTLLSARKSVTIGSRVMIGNQCIVADTDVPGTVERAAVGAPGAESEGLEPREIEIGDRVWLAVRVTVPPGVRIWVNSVITACSVVSESIPPGVIAAGIPARVLKGRNDEGEVPARVVVRARSHERVAALVRRRRERPRPGRKAHDRQQRADAGRRSISLGLLPGRLPHGERSQSISPDRGRSVDCLSRRSKQVRIGNGTRIGPFVIIMDTDFHAIGDQAVRHDEVKPIAIRSVVRIGVASRSCAGA